MKNKVNWLLLSTALVLAACVPVKDTTLPGEPEEVAARNIYTCKSKLDPKLDFKYDPKKATVWHSEQYNVNVYSIVTVDGKHISLNSLELQNYTCF